MPVALFPVWVTLAGAVGLAYLYGHDPRDPAQLLPKCVFHLVTGWNCPACGGTRMTYALLHGDMAGAFEANPVLLAALPFAGLAHGRWMVAGLRGERYRVALRRRGVVLVVASAVVWTVVRNLAGR
ncbi:DUF2752 domain-containing protein [Streptomyces sp. NPDC059070]|uniref:DUF2752 domain-containing protein n=1 Tax=unclassified Streptomyces TaxID=2593676 RepID=UPI0034E2EA92